MLSTCAPIPTKHPHTQGSGKVLFPLSIGQYWIYQVKSGTKSGTIENRIVSSRTIGNIEWFLSMEYGDKFWIRNTPAGQAEAVNLYTKGEDAAIFEQLDPKVIREELLFKFPAKAGDQWVALENTLRYEGRRRIDTPAGSFDCHWYSITSYLIDKKGQTYSHSCIAEGVGVVYSDNLLEDGTLEISRLQSWGKR